MTEPTSHTLDVPGATLAYDIRPNDASTEPVLLLIGSPMGAGGFGTLAGYFTDRTVVTYDPRGSDRSKRIDGATQNTVEERQAHLLSEEALRAFEVGHGDRRDDEGIGKHACMIFAPRATLFVWFGGR